MKIGEIVHVVDCPTSQIVKTGALESVQQTYFAMQYVIDGEQFNVSQKDVKSGIAVISEKMLSNLITKGGSKYSDYINVRNKFMLGRLESSDFDVVISKLQEIDTILSAKVDELGLSEEIESFMRIWSVNGSLPSESFGDRIQSREIKEEAKTALASRI